MSQTNDSSDASTKLDQTIYTKDTEFGEFEIGLNISRAETSVNYNLLVRRVSDGECWVGTLDRDASAVRIDFPLAPVRGVRVPDDMLDQIAEIKDELDAEDDERRKAWLDSQDELELEAVEQTETYRINYVTDRYLVWVPQRNIHTDAESELLSRLRNEDYEILVKDESVEAGDTLTLSELTEL